MAYDRIIDLDEVPDEAHIRKLLYAYLAGAGYVEFKGGRHYASLEGNGQVLTEVLGRPKEMTRKERFFEVVMTSDHLSVITRQADDYTNAVADGFYKLLKRQGWDGALALRKE